MSTNYIFIDNAIGKGVVNGLVTVFAPRTQQAASGLPNTAGSGGYQLSYRGGFKEDRVYNVASLGSIFDSGGANINGRYLRDYFTYNIPSG